MLKRFRLQYCLAWVLMLIGAQWTVGRPVAGASEILAIAMVALGLPSSLLAALLLVFLSAAFPNTLTAGFWAGRTGLLIGGVLLFAAGYLQWFVLVPWLRSRLRRDPAT